MNDVEELVLSLAPQGDRRWLQLAKDGQPLPIRPPLIDQNGDMVPAQIFRSYYKGYTVVLNQVQRRLPSLRRYCSTLEDIVLRTTGVILKDPISANIYLTPPNSRGFSAHCDNHDVFILQVDGSKTWRLYNPPVAFPVEPITKFDSGVLGTPTHTETLRAGTVMYLPRGIPHEGLTSSEHSLHITISMRAFTKLDLVVNVARFIPDVRRTLLIQNGNEDQGFTPEDLKSLLAAFADSRLVHSNLRLLRNQRLTSSLPAMGEHVRVINALDTIGESTILTRRSPTGALIKNGTQLTLHYPGVTATYETKAGPSLRLLLSNDRVRVQDLPGFESASERIDFVKRLVGEGFLSLPESESVASAA